MIAGAFEKFREWWPRHRLHVRIALLSMVAGSALTIAWFLVTWVVNGSSSETGVVAPPPTFARPIPFEPSLWRKARSDAYVRGNAREAMIPDLLRRSARFPDLNSVLADLGAPDATLAATEATGLLFARPVPREAALVALYDDADRDGRRRFLAFHVAADGTVLSCQTGSRASGPSRP